MSTVIFYAQFTKSKVGQNSLTVTWDIERITRSDGTRSALVTGGANSVTIGRRGLYGYVLTGADLLTYDYVATAITADSTVDMQEVAALWTFWALSWHDVATAGLTLAGSFGKLVTDFLDAAVSSRLASASYTAPDNTNIGLIKAVTDKLNSLLELVSGVTYRFTAAALELSPSGTATISSADKTDISNRVWSNTYNAIRALTNPLVTWANIPVKNTVQAIIGDTVEISITGLGSLVGRTKLYWTLKNSNGTGDDGAIVQIKETNGVDNGLLVLNGSDDLPTGVKGFLVVDDESAGNITITLEAELSTLLPALDGAKWDVKYVSSTLKAVKAQGRFNSTYTSTHAIT